jgi:phage shock protein PspC (stress-responsive transcriptional regulator)
MFKVILGVTAGLGALLLWQLYPDIVRYLRIRAM